MFKAALLICLIINVKPSSFGQDTIYWKSNKMLKWDDFEGPIDTSRKTYVAISYTGILLKSSYGLNGLSFTIAAYFSKQKSWIRKKNSSVIKHEQGHFDIAEIHARKLRQALKNYKPGSQSSLLEDINKLYLSVLDEKKRMNSQYDSDTDHSRNKERQVLWEKKIQSDLNYLNGFKE